MKIVVAVKVVADDQDIFVAGDRSLDYSKAHQIISAYDKNAIEAAAQLAAANDGQVVVISAATTKATDAKLKRTSCPVALTSSSWLLMTLWRPQILMQLHRFSRASSTRSALITT